ncbi:MAG: PAS domain-containing protein [Desulfobacteraceae bacterium]|nr:PAS domain-containing protein [Desulfobacteraceae bacterium]
MQTAWKKRRQLYEKAEVLGNFGHWTRDFETDQGTWSEGMCRIFGITRDKFQPPYSFFLSFVHPEDAPAVKDAALTAISTGANFEVQYRIIRPDGSLRYMHSIGEIIGKGGNRIAEIFGISQDITRLRRLEKCAQAPADGSAPGQTLQICAYCKRIRNDNDSWQHIETYLQEQTGTLFSHSICPECYGKCNAEYFSINTEDMQEKD